MSYRTNLIYRYDGSFEGLMTCVFESYARRELPDAILPPDSAQTMLFESRSIAADYEKAGRVLRGLESKVSRDAADFVRLAHLTCLNDRDRLILLFIRLAMQTGPNVMNNLTDARVNALWHGVNYLTREAHHYMGFVRFKETGGLLASVILPKNRVLPLLDPHFSDRFNAERFVIYDAAHHEALMHQPGCSRILPLDSFVMPDAKPDELHVQALWRRFHETVAIEGRLNPKLQRNLLPLFRRPFMTEFQTPQTFKEEGVPIEKGSCQRIGAI